VRSVSEWVTKQETGGCACCNKCGHRKNVETETKKKADRSEQNQFIKTSFIGSLNADIKKYAHLRSMTATICKRLLSLVSTHLNE
jgi:hypothetical protein